MALKMAVYTKDLELNEKLSDYVNKKVLKLERFLSENGDCRVDLAYAKTARNAGDRYIAQVTIRGRGFILRSEERADSVQMAIDATVEKMSRQIERFKGKQWRKRTDDFTEKTEADQIALDEEEVGMPKITRRKSFGISPMDENEAMEQLILLGHEDFFVFFNVDTGRVNVLYRRRDGDYGLIDPVVA